ncbi:MAG: outer membrane lipoprotein carrier protein LolA [Desulfobacteraceae bacterium]|nr:outer membrane lipoprotein carrier protein LolA [Desulfobacteraceae bacterium]
MFISVFVLAGSFFFLGWADNLEGIKQNAQDIRSIQADFVQEKHMKILIKPLVSEGKLYFSYPQSLRWEYIHPIQSILVMHNGDIKRYVMSSEGMIEDSSAALQAMQVFLAEMSSWIQGDFEKNTDFTATLQPGGIIFLKPKDPAMAKIIEKIALQLTDIPGIIESATIYETPTTYTLIKFKNTKINQKIDESVFQGINYSDN